MATLNIDSSGRQNVGRIDHVVYAYESRASRDAARKEFTELLDIHTWTEIGEIPGAGIEVIIDWNSGIELLCPAREENILTKGLARHGEGFHGAIFGVADLDAAVERAERAGAKVIRLGSPPDITFTRFEVAREAIIHPKDIGGLAIVLGEFKPVAGKEVLRADDRGRMYPGGIDHLVFAFAEEATMRAAAARLSEVLGVSDWQDFTVETPGLRILFDIDAGIELICPTRPGGPIDAHVAKYGAASFYAQVMAADDIDKAMERVTATGASATERPVEPVLLKHYAEARQAMIGRVGGIPTIVAEVVQRENAAAAG